jgi:hypothetical protein
MAKLKPMTVEQLQLALTALTNAGQIKKTDKIYLYSDEEGNEVLPLVNDIDISFAKDKGELYFIPCRI